MKNLIVEPGMSPEEKGVVILTLVERSRDPGKKAPRAFAKLFGTNAPHQVLQNISHLNARACTQEYNENIFRLLAGNPEDFYDDSDFYEQHSLAYMSSWQEGTVLHRWERYTNAPNPHHIVPRSRGGTSNSRNLWRADRSIHDDIHTVFQNLTPQDQIRFLLNYYKNIFGRDFSQEVYTILKYHPEPECYIKEVVSPHKFC